MENNQNLMDNSEVVQMLEQLRHDIDTDIEKRKLAYIRDDGHDYYDKESLDAANKAYIERMYTFIGTDGKTYFSSDHLNRANAISENEKAMQQSIYIGNDGKPYGTIEELNRANVIYENEKTMQQSAYNGHDGKTL